MLGRFELVEPIGSGGQGQVWRAIHLDLGLSAAVKLVLPGQPASDELRQSLAHEIRAVARLDHPNIVCVFDFGAMTPAEASATRSSTGDLWFAMELVTGGTLADLAPPPSLEEALPLVDDLLSALAHAHARGVLHLDLKPRNILVAGPHDLRSGPKLSDFGIATTDAVGPRGATRRYAAPEQWSGGEVTGATDLFALGRTLMVWGIPPGLEEWLAKCTETDPSARFPSAAAAQRALPAHPTAPRRRQARSQRGVRSLGAALFDLRRPALIGRAQPLAELRGWWRGVERAGLPSCCAIVGPRAVGTTAVARSFAERLAESGIPVLHYTDSGSPTALLDWARMHRHAPTLVWVDQPQATLTPLFEDLAAREAPVGLLLVSGDPRARPSGDLTLVHVGPLGDRHVSSMLAEWLPLEGSLVTSVVATAEGRPGWARATVSQWLRSGMLEWRSGRWAHRSEAASAAASTGLLPATHVHLLTLAAALGTWFPGHRWVRTAAYLGFGPTEVEEAARGALAAGILVGTGEPWSFDRASQAEALLAALTAEERTELHRACHDAWRAETGGVSYASAHHLHLSGDRDRALEQFSALAAEAEQSGDSARQALGLEQVVRIRMERQDPIADKPFLRERLKLIWALRHSGAAGRAIEEGRQLIDDAHRAADVYVEAVAWGILSDAVRDDDAELAVEWARRAILPGLGVNPAVHVHCTLAQSLQRLHRLAEAFEVVAPWAARIDEASSSKAMLARTLGRIELARGNTEVGQRWLLRSLEFGGGLIPQALVSLGELLQREGRYDEARAVFREYHQHAEAKGGKGDRTEGWLNLAAVEVRARCFEAAIEFLVELDDREAPLLAVHGPLVDLLWTACLIETEDWEEVDRRTSRLGRAARVDLLIDRDASDLLDDVAARLATRGPRRLATRTAKLALGVRARLAELQR